METEEYTEHFPENVDAWELQYKPIKNHIDTDSSWGGIMFETFDKEVEYVWNIVQTKGENYVWTWIDGDGDSEESSGTFLISGFHHVNRIGYFVCEVPWTTFEEVIVEKFPFHDNEDEDTDE